LSHSAVALVSSDMTNMSGWGEGLKPGERLNKGFRAPLYRYDSLKEYVAAIRVS